METALTVKLGWADAPANAARFHVLGVSLLCSIGFTMSLFIGALVVPDAPSPRSGTKIEILLGSAVAALFGSIVLSHSPKPGWAEATSEDRLG